MEFRELTASVLAFWGAGCAEHILSGAEKQAFVRRRNQWIVAHLGKGLSGVVMLDWGRIVGFTLELPVEYAPVPAMGKGIVAVFCSWTAPAVTNPAHRKLLWEHALERFPRRGYKAVLAAAPFDVDVPLLEALGFRKIGEGAHPRARTSFMFKEFVACQPPVLKRGAPIPPPKHRKFALDLFYQPFCPLGTVILNEVLNQVGGLAQRVELRIHDAADKRVVMEFGITLGCFLNGRDVTLSVVAGEPLADILDRLERDDA